MHPKKNLDQLNRQRALQKKIRFIKRRMVETLVELPFARGKIDSLPREMPTPPAWALNAARLAMERVLAPFKRLSPEAIKEDPVGAVREMIGLFLTMRAHIRKETDALVRDHPRSADFRALKEVREDFTPAHLLAHLRKLEQVLEVKLPSPTAKELIEHADRYRLGLTEFIDGEDGIVPLRNLKTQILYVIWYFWPYLDKAKEHRAADLQRFLADEIGLHASIKTVEAVYTEVRLADRGCIQI